MIYLFKTFRQSTGNAKPDDKIDELIDAVKSGFEKSNEVKQGHFCKLHPGIKAAGTCAVCDEMFCEDCLMELDSLNLCPEHFRLVNENEWSVIDSVKTDSNDPEMSMYLYHFKKKLWKENMIPTYVVTHYQINVEHDQIVSQIDLFAKRSEQFSISSELEKFKQKSNPKN